MIILILIYLESLIYYETLIYDISGSGPAAVRMCQCITSGRYRRHYPAGVGIYIPDLRRHAPLSDSSGH